MNKKITKYLVFYFNGGRSFVSQLPDYANDIHLNKLIDCHCRTFIRHCNYYYS